MSATATGAVLLEVSERIEGAHSIHTGYPLLPGDVVRCEPDGTYSKLAPGLGIGGFVLTPAQAATLQPTEGVVAIVGNL